VPRSGQEVPPELEFFFKVEAGYLVLEVTLFQLQFRFNAPLTPHRSFLLVDFQLSSD
jgi:hypothetical protein